jgi:hypothetical protein
MEQVMGARRCAGVRKRVWTREEDSGAYGLVEIDDEWRQICRVPV